MAPKVKPGARLGAATLLAGVCMAIPQAMAIAAADGRDAAPGPDASSGASTSASSPAANHPSRASRPGPRGGGVGRIESTPVPGAAEAPARSAASESAPRTAVAAAAADPPPAGSRGAGPEADDTPAAAPAVVSPAVVPAEPAPASSRAVAAPARGPATPPAASTAAAPPVPVIAPAATAPPAPTGALAAVTASAGAGANAASASLIDRLLAPIRTLFGEGTALLVRRALFNQAPTVAPVQLTGQGEGPITGTIGAVDLEQDPLTYAITATPLHGSAVVNADGTYTYTPGTGFAGTDSFVVAVTDTGRHLNLLDLGRPASTSASVAVTRGALAAMLRFQFVYGSGSLHWSDAARSALESAATALSSYIVVDSPVTVTYAVTGARSPFSSTLASAGSDFVDDGSGFLQTVVQNKILTGADANGSAADGMIDWNFGPSWAFGSSVANTQYDFTSIAMHELLHTMGFLSNIDKSGSNTGDVWTVFDSYVVNSAGARAINGGTYTWNSAYNSNLTGGNGGLYFGGPDAVAAYGALVPLYTPNPWEAGSSMSHLNDNVFSGSRKKLMNAVTSTGQGIRALSPVELGVLADIGYNVSGTPVLLFFGLISLRPRRRPT